MAGSNAIASGSAILTTNADGLKAGLDKSQKDVLTWGQKVGNGLSSTFNAKGGTLGAFQHIGTAVTGKLAGLASAAKGLLSGAGVAIGTAIGGPIGGAIGGAIGSAVGSLGEVVVGALASPFEKIDQFAKLTKQAAGVGIGASQFQGLTQQFERFGIDADGATLAFQKFGAKLTDAAQFGAPQATAAFERLGLSAGELSRMPLDQAFLKASDAIKSLGTPAQQAHAAIALFGKAGTQLLPILQKGGSGIQEFIDQQKKLGAVLSDSQLKAAGDASKAWKEAKQTIAAAWDGLKNRATLIAAPIIQFVGKAVSTVFTFLVPVFDWVGRAVSKVAEITSAVFEQLTKWFEEAGNWLKELGADVMGFTGEWPSVQDVVVSVFRAIGEVGAYTWDYLKAGAGLAAIAIGKIMEGLGSLASQFKGTLRSLAETGADAANALGLNDTEKTFRRIAEAASTLGPNLKRSGQEMSKWGQDQVNGIGSSADKFNKWLDAAMKPKAAGVKAGEQFGEGLMESMEPLKLATAMKAGSKEAYSLIVKNQLRGLNVRDEPIKNLVKETKKGNDLKKQGNKDTKKIADKFDLLGVI